jgi:hypothetical protein
LTRPNALTSSPSLSASLQTPSVRMWCWIGTAGYGKPVVIQVLESLYGWVPASGNSDPDGLGQTSLTVTTLHHVHRLLGFPLFGSQQNRLFCVPLYAVDDLSTTHMASS